MTGESSSYRSALQPGDLVEIVLGIHGYLGPSCGCGLRPGMQGVVISGLYTSMETGFPNHNVQFSIPFKHGCWVKILRKIQPPPDLEAKSELGELLDTFPTAKETENA